MVSGRAGGLAYQLGDDFSVGLRPEVDAVLRLELLLELVRVLDDAVVHHRDAARLVQMRVGVLVRAGAMGGPAGVRDTGDVGVVLAQVLLEEGDGVVGLAHAGVLGHRQFVCSRINRGDASRIVAARFEHLETFDEDRRCGFTADEGDDAADIVVVDQSVESRRAVLQMPLKDTKPPRYGCAGV
jgi:hypothetical protein